MTVVSWDLQVYSNRAASYTKLGAMPEGLKDAEKCIELDPTFSKGYTRKGAVQFFMKEYEKALETYQEGLKHDPNNQELLDGVSRLVHWPIYMKSSFRSKTGMPSLIDNFPYFFADAYNRLTKLAVEI